MDHVKIGCFKKVRQLTLPDGEVVTYYNEDSPYRTFGTASLTTNNDGSIGWRNASNNHLGNFSCQDQPISDPDDYMYIEFVIKDLR